MAVNSTMPAAVERLMLRTLSLSMGMRTLYGERFRISGGRPRVSGPKTRQSSGAKAKCYKGSPPRAEVSTQRGGVPPFSAVAAASQLSQSGQTSMRTCGQ